jgi:hypothetical protein
MKEKHPYYDNERKKITETYALRLILYSFIMLFLLIITMLIT